MHASTKVALATAGGATAALVLWARFVEPAWIDVTSTELDWTGPHLRIALLTDLHTRAGGAARMRRIVRRTARVRPDLVLFGGDFVDGVDATDAKLAALAPLAARRAPLGAYAVLGNHDSKGGRAIARVLSRAGIRVLSNEHVVLPGGVVLVGLGDLRAGRADPASAFAGAPPDAPTIVLAHEPRSFELAGLGRFDIALAGHTHGGQGCIPFTNVCPFLEDDMKPYSRGLYELPGGKRLYVSRGLGTSTVPARIGARPEVASIELTVCCRSRST